MKRVFSLLLALCLMLSTFGLAYAESTQIVAIKPENTPYTGEKRLESAEKRKLKESPLADGWSWETPNAALVPGRYVTETAVNGANAVEVLVAKQTSILTGTSASYVRYSGDTTVILCDGVADALVSVLVDGVELSTDCYSIAPGSDTRLTFAPAWLNTLDEGEHTVVLVYEACSSSVKLEVIPSTPGALNLIVSINGDIPESDIEETKRQLIEILKKSGYLTDDEINTADQGGVIKLVLTIEDADDTITAESAAVIATVLDGWKVGKYLDISLELFKFGVTTEIREIAEPVTIIIPIPDELINTNPKVKRTYKVIRNHEGVAEVLDTEYDKETQSLCFRTNLFSDYAICYLDTDISDEPQDDPDSSDGDESDPGDVSGDESSDSSCDSSGSCRPNDPNKTIPPKTGDDSKPGLWMFMTITSGLLLFFVIIKRRNDEKESENGKER